jgi:hypothetical protein
MKQQANFRLGLHHTWGIIDGTSYPYLRWQSARRSFRYRQRTGGKTIQSVVNGANLAATTSGADGSFYLRCGQQSPTAPRC